MEFDSFTMKCNHYNRFEIYFDCLKEIKKKNYYPVGNEVNQTFQFSWKLDLVVNESQLVSMGQIESVTAELCTAEEFLVERFPQ